MKKIEKVSFVSIHIAYVLALAAVIFPLLLVAGYNFPSADDWSYGKNAYRALQEGGGFWDVLRCAFENMIRNYREWEGRFCNSFLASLQPGIWGEKYYFIVPWMLLGGLIVGEIGFAWMLLTINSRENRKLVLPIVIPSLIMQILYTPSISESFYWYTGGINYTFIFGLSLILCGMFLRLAAGKITGRRLLLTVPASCILAILVGGDNFSTSVSVFLGMVIFSVLFVVRYREGLRRTWYLTAIVGGSLAACILAPGNTSRLEGNFGGTTTGNAVAAVWQSLVRTFTNLYSWTDGKVFVLILLVLPFVWMAVGNMTFQFKFPAAFTVLTYGVYASQMTATMYVDGTTGGGRVAGILYFTYHIWIISNLVYWMGWLRQKGVGVWMRKHGFMTFWRAVCQKGILPWCAVTGLILCGIIYKYDLKEISSYRVYRDWRQGWAEQYAADWENRLMILRDSSVTEVEFAPVSVLPEAYVYTDLQDKDGYVWVNKACASYYGKKSVMVVEDAQIMCE